MKSSHVPLSDVARQLLLQADVGILATHSLTQQGFPFTSLVQFALSEAGEPIFLLSGLAEHTKNVLQDPRTSLFARDSRAGEPQSTGRVTVVGEMERLPESEIPAARELFLKRHPQAELWSSFGDFRWFRMVPQAIYVVAGFGQMGWVK